MTESERHARIGDLLVAALERPIGAREAYLAEACSDDPTLREEVQALLDADTDAGPLDWPALRRPNPVGADPFVGRALGPWHLDARIGEGGMGAVYRAHRADGLYRREVAVKVLPPGPGAAPLARRLEDERRILARLEHPHIARLYDGGLTDAGAPFLVMALVDGAPITNYATRESLGVEACVRLFLQVCEAVAYAHQHLVVHRDLKPSNVLVADGADGPHATLLDFGIATLLDDSPDLRTRTTAAMTPAYAAPEQLRGEPVTTATDVYSLGGLFYELLTGTRPHDLSGKTAAETERIVCDTTPARPSETAPSARSRTLRGDLDTVCLKALAKEPGARYRSAEALADDLRRWLEGFPIEARPPSATYRLRRFVQRHRGPVLAGTAVLAFVTLLITFYTVRLRAERDTAGRRFAIAQEAARAMLYDVHDAVAPLPGATPAREVIVSSSLDYLDRLADEAGDDPSLRRDLAEAYFRIGNVLGNPTDANLGRTADARAAYTRGLSMLSPPTLPRPGDTLAAQTEAIRGRLYEKRGVVSAFMGDLDDGLDDLEWALAAHGRALRAAPDDPERPVYLATAHINRGDYAGHPYFPNAGRPEEALDHYARARALIEGVPENDRGLFALRMLGITYERTGNLYRERGDLDDALAAAQQALRLRETITTRPDASVDAARDVGVSHEAVGRIYRAQGRLDDALDALERAFTIYQGIADADPENRNARETLAFGHLQLAHLHGGPEAPHRGERAEARRHYAAALALFRALAAEDPENERTADLVAETEREAAAIGG